MAKNNLTWRVTELEKSYTTLDGKVDSILQNHLPHLHEEIKTLQTRINILIVAVVAEVGVILLGKFL